MEYKLKISTHHTQEQIERFCAQNGISILKFKYSRQLMETKLTNQMIAEWADLSGQSLFHLATWMEENNINTVEDALVHHHDETVTEYLDAQR